MARDARSNSVGSPSSVKRLTRLMAGASRQACALKLLRPGPSLWLPSYLGARQGHVGADVTWTFRIVEDGGDGGVGEVVAVRELHRLFDGVPRRAEGDVHADCGDDHNDDHEPHDRSDGTKRCDGGKDRSRFGPLGNERLMLAGGC